MKPLQSLPTGPYQIAARVYLDNGWRPLPLPARKKSSPPSDWTGGSKPNSGKRPSKSQMATWAKEYPQGNIAISPPKNVIGIDVDMYDGKAGAETLAAAEEAWGELPASWISTSRTDGSGIRLYRIPEGLAWPGQLPQGGGIELIRWDHRYAIVSPSIHPEDREYIWITPGGNRAADEFPAPEDLPMLPEKWVEGLTAGKKWEARAEADLDPAEVQTWIEDRGDHALCRTMEQTLRRHLQEVRLAGANIGDKAAHDAMTEGVWALVGDSALGHSGLVKALTRFKAAFLEAVRLRPDRSDREARAEWTRAKSGAVRKVVTEGDPEDEDPCELSETSRAPRERKRIGATDVWERNDTGNAQRFASRYRNSVRWCAAFGSWFIWSDKDNVWSLDRDGEVTRMAMETASQIRQEAAFEEDPKLKAAILKFANASASKEKLQSMTGLARDLRGMSVEGGDLDARRDLLVCPNGTLELEHSDGSVRLRPSRPEDYNTVSTGTQYVAGAELPEWEKFLSRFQPDREIRDWLQKLAGYSILGRNPKRLMVIAMGDTSTGKTTFAKVVSGALGSYASGTTMTVFRDNQDERPRADLVRVLNRRFVFAEEASASWHLHPDQVKRITGGATIQARVPYAKEYLDVVPAFTPWLFTNAAPTIEGADAALWRRIVVVPFDIQIPENEEDDQFVSTLETAEGRSAVLAWLVEGYKAYLADPDSLTFVPAGAEAAGRKLRAEVSDFASAIEDICEYGEPDDYWVIPGQLYTAYIQWCEDHSVKERDRISGTKFGRDIGGLGFKKSSVRIDGKPVTVRRGIRLKPEWAKVSTS
jgi:putative DNA primase/helicase